MIFNKSDTLTTERTFSETQTGNTTGYQYLASIQRNLSSILKKEKKKPQNTLLPLTECASRISMHICIIQ